MPLTEFECFGVLDLIGFDEALKGSFGVSLGHSQVDVLERFKYSGNKLELNLMLLMRSGIFDTCTSIAPTPI
ncbi:MAG: hypothetical protein F6K28_43060 [Microcoleus sp. SIO2G3]|nr:hypothetical protein [Microcoleus sp. SIO2G3]